MLEQYLRQTRNDSYPLVFSTPELAQAAIDEYKSTISREGDTQVEKKTIVPQPQASFVIMDQYTRGVKSNRRRTRREDGKPFSQPCDGICKTAWFLF
mgnify:CR=1 FL=1